MIWGDHQVLRGGGLVSKHCALDYFRPTRPQREFLEWECRNGVWRGGNQIGKTRAHAVHIVHLMRGTHPWRPVRYEPPVEVLLAGYSWQQMDKLLREVWTMLPPAEIDPRLRYEKGGGIRGFKEPRIPLVAGPGKGSVAHLRTYKQGAESIAGMEVVYAGLDEPPYPGIIGEVMGRTSTYDGDCRVTMTPTPESPPQDELRELVETKVWADRQTTLSLEACWPEGALTPWRTRRAIEAKIASWLPLERPMRRDGAWEPVLIGRQLDAFAEQHQRQPPTGVDVQICVATDHGIRPGRQGTVVLAFDSRGRVWAIAEYRPAGTTSSVEDGKGIVAALASVGLTVYDVAYWVGDRAAESRAAKKDNARLADAIASAAGVDRRSAGIWLSVPHKSFGSSYAGIALVNGLLHEDRLFVDPDACPELLKSILRWEGKKKDPAKDLLDCLRYGCEELVDQQEISRPQVFLAA